MQPFKFISCNASPLFFTIEQLGSNCYTSIELKSKQANEKRTKLSNQTSKSSNSLHRLQRFFFLRKALTFLLTNVEISATRCKPTTFIYIHILYIICISKSKPRLVPFSESNTSNQLSDVDDALYRSFFISSLLNKVWNFKTPNSKRSEFVYSRITLAFFDKISYVTAWFEPALHISYSRSDSQNRQRSSKIFQSSLRSTDHSAELFIFSYQLSTNIRPEASNFVTAEVL